MAAIHYRETSSFGPPLKQVRIWLARSAFLRSLFSGPNSLFLRFNSLFGQKNSLFLCAGNSRASARKCGPNWAPIGAESSDSRIFPVFSLLAANATARGAEFAADCHRRQLLSLCASLCRRS